MDERVNFETLHRPTSPNTCLLAPKWLCGHATPDIESPIFLLSPDRLFAEISLLVGAYDHWSVHLNDETARQIECIATTKVLKFKDDIAIRVIPDVNSQEKSQLAIYSRSRVGYHDLGANRKRVELLLRELNQYTQTTV
ncbi:DUF1499 domain-containing protein [Henriciella sp.]|uniref:DUF1499 domain-containing protein n=1 Tax=Henriciella sp. TaxID=1968823 RepID=UPI0026342E80|nr:DUF1499 domain-containing protein [Henriciella sp.]